MINMRKEGDIFQRGFNIMLAPHRVVTFMWGTYNHRILFGIGWSRVTGWYVKKGYWNKDEDIKILLRFGSLVTMEQALNGGYKHKGWNKKGDNTEEYF